MICINNSCTNPYFNLAAEEFLFTRCSEDVFMLWRNEPSIILGKFQNTRSEINMDYVNRHHIKVVRRMSGGGAVFHDLGNLNFTFIKHNSNGNFKTFTEPILNVLHQLSVDAQFEGRNDLTIKGAKISGNAQCIHNRDIMHHGTLLFSAEMTDMSAALNVDPLKFQDKAVKSVRKRVTNISEHLLYPLRIEEFTNLIMQYVMENTSNSENYNFSQEDFVSIEKLKKEKYETWDWNFGYSPKCEYTKKIRTKGGSIQVEFNVVHGRIKNFHLYGDFFVLQDLEILEQQFENKLYKEDSLRCFLDTIPVEKFLRHISAADIEQLIF